MTCIIGWIENGDVYMGSDSMISSGYIKYAQNIPKIIRRGNVLMGLTGRCRNNNLLAHSLVVPRIPEKKEDIMAYMVNEFVYELRECYRKAGFLKKSHEVEKSHSKFLVGIKGLLFEVDFDFNVMGFDKYHTAGSGEEVALGALSIMSRKPFSDCDTVSSMKPEDKVIHALRSAGDISYGVGPPYHVMWGENEHKQEDN